MFFDEDRDNTLYENLVVNDDLKQQMLKACKEAQEKSSRPDDELSSKRERINENKSVYGTLIRNVSVAVVSICASGLLIIAAVNQIGKNKGGSTPSMAKDTTGFTTEKLSDRNAEKLTDNSKETELVTSEEEGMYGDYKDIKAAIDQFDIYSDKWKDLLSDEGSKYGVKYTMTDLDHNGNPEIIVTNIEGTMYRTNLHIFELEDGKPKERVKLLDSESMMSLPDISLSDELVCYHDMLNDSYTYLGIDYFESKEAEGVMKIESKVDFSLDDGMFDLTVRNTKTTKENKTTYADWDGNKITKKEYEKYDDKTLDESKDFEKSTVKLKWVDLKNGSQELLDCYKVFINEE
ncbi:hypothetical protein SAMN02745111_01671 [Eubacterium uniforme]|uniref:Uncharacterized protein n=1 Tax=Eubacterium uniforme TaxID=39495 RepID=A0A1T4VVQ0_9FIRM|nr:hypothetical protein [Eubacterium uniforme]SKA68898.1 hypothetical protein SAMN02745111_01671 [Eubacterium uniforme]